MVGFARRWGCLWNPPAAREPDEDDDQDDEDDADEDNEDDDDDHNDSESSPVYGARSG